MCEKSEYKVEINKNFTIYCQVSGKSIKKIYTPTPSIILSKLETRSLKKLIVSYSQSKFK